MPDKTFFITTAISYPNGPPHIGQAYEALATDALARFKRLDGYEVLFLTGTDEHGQKIQQTAEKQGKTAAEFVEEMTPLFQRMVATLNCSNDDFIRTTEPRHHRSVAELWRRMEAAGDIYLGTYSGWYSVRDEAFYGESELVERDGQKFAPSGTPVEWVEEESYFFPPVGLSGAPARPLRGAPGVHRAAGAPQRGRELRARRLAGPVGVAHHLRLGHPGAGPARPRHVCLGRRPDQLRLGHRLSRPARPRAKFWPADVHIIGKDIVRFHAVYWPAFLMSAGLALPKRVYGHGFLFNKGEKMSKSVGNVIDPFPLVAHYGVDQVRYFFLREVPFGQDGNYSHEAIVNRINADLANDFGNLAQRSLSMIAKNCQGRVPEPGPLSPEDEAILEAADGIIVEARQHHEVQALHRALDAIWRVVADANRYFAGQEPWALRKTDPSA
jgi:methionyl-tRNA synthetase